jgi:ferredoxin
MVPACATRVAEGMSIQSQTPAVHAMRLAAVELLLAEHTGDCFAPCQSVCPAHMDIPTMLRQISSGNLKDAIVTVKEAIPLPAVLGRICPELCEKGCRRSHRDAAVSICSLKRFVADKDLAEGSPYLPQKAMKTGHRVAIVGTGPAGLTAAWFLLQQGHGVVLYDGNPLPGGALRYSIDESRLPRAVLDSEIDLVRALGAEFVMNTHVGQTVSMNELSEEFDAVLVAAGPTDRHKASLLGMEFAGQGIKTDRKTMMTSRRGLFAAGSAVLPLHYAIRAVADGRAAAEGIHQFLSGSQTPDKGKGMVSRMAHLSETETEAFFDGASDVPRGVPKGGLVAGLTDEQAISESARCAHCDCGKLGGCRLRQVADQLGADPHRYRGARREFRRQNTHPLVVYEPGKCILCGLCVQIASRAAEPLGLTFVGRGFAVEVAAPLGEDLTHALTVTARQCAEACPTGALVMRKDVPPCAEGPVDRRVKLSLPLLRM